MSQARGVFRNTAVLAGARIIERAMGLVLALLIAREIGVAGLGVYAAAMAIYGLLAIAGEAGTTNYLIREIVKDPSRTSRYVVHLTILATMAASVLTVGALLAIPHLGYSDALQTSVTVVLLAILPTTLNSVQEAVFVAYGRVEFETLTTFVAALLNVGAAVVLLANDHGVSALVASFVIIEYLVTLTYFVLITRFIVRLRWGFSTAFARQLIGEIKAFTASSALAALFSRPEIILLTLLSTDRQLGYYGAAVKAAEMFAFVPQVFMANVFPVLTRSHHAADDRFEAIQGRAARYLLAFSLPVTAGMVAAAEPIMSVLYGDGFGPGVGVLRALAANLTFFSLTAVLWRTLAARGRQDAVLRVQVLTIASRLASGYVLIASTAAIGAAIATSANALIHAALLARAARRDGAPLPVVRIGWRFLLAAGGMGLAVAALVDRMELWLLVPLGAVIYVVAAVALRAFSREDWVTLRGLVSPRRSAPAER